MDKWTELRTAYQVARLGTVSAAAEALGVHRATINRHIDVLEHEIGGKVFIRHARGYALTDIGEDLLRVAQKTEELIEDLTGRVQGRQAEIGGEIKLTLLAPFAGLLMGAIAQFRAENPQCLVNVHVGEGLARLEYGEAHIALRAGAKPENPDYVVSRFEGVRFNLYAHESYIARHGLPAGEHDLAGHRFVTPEFPNERLPFAPWLAAHVDPSMIALSTPDISVAVDAIEAGIGIGFIGDEEARRRGGFTAVRPPDVNWVVDAWIVTHVDLHRTEKVQAMLRCIKSSRAGRAT